MSKIKIFEEMGIKCETYNPENPDDCGYGKCFYEDEEGKKIETVVVDVLPHLHEIETYDGQRNNDNVKNYFLKEIEECKNDNHQTVLNIFFESLIGTDLSSIFSKNPKKFIRITNEIEDPELKKEAIKELQFKKPLMEQCYREEKNDKKVENVKIQWIPVPGKKEEKKLEKVCNSILTKVNEILENKIKYIDLLYLIRDIENGSSEQVYISPQIAERIPKESISKVIVAVKKELGKESIIMETREFLAIETMINYINEQKIGEEEVHKYFLVFGKAHWFYKWNACDLKKQFPRKKIMVKFVRNTSMHSNNASCPINKVFKK